MSNQYTLADDKLVVFVAGEKYTFSVAGLSEMEMRKSKRNRALTLIAMIILELEFAHGGPTPTQEAILNKVIAV